MLFGLAVMWVTVVWLVVLPRLARTPAVQERAHWLQVSGVNPAAFNYSDHPASQEMLRTLERMATSSGVSTKEETGREIRVFSEAHSVRPKARPHPSQTAK
jgi:hypothetical protein